MKKIVIVCLIGFAAAMFAGCGPKRLPPGEPPVDTPTTQPPAQPETPTERPTPPQTPQEPPPPSKPPLEAPKPKPRAASKGDPASVKLMEGGIKQLNAGNLAEAEQMFEQALRVSPTNGKPYYYLAVIAAKQKNYERALGFLQQAQTYLHNDDFWTAQILVQEGVILKLQNKNAEAREKFRSALKKDPDNQWAAKELKELDSKKQ